jgi:hypothetical protein
VSNFTDPKVVSVRWDELLVTFADGATSNLTVKLVAEHWASVTWYPRTDNFRAWRGAQVHRVGEVPTPTTPRCAVDWSGLKVQASALAAKRGKHV